MSWRLMKSGFMTGYSFTTIRISLHRMFRGFLDTRTCLINDWNLYKTRRTDMRSTTFRYQRSRRCSTSSERAASRVYFRVTSQDDFPVFTWGLLIQCGYSCGRFMLSWIMPNLQTRWRTAKQLHGLTLPQLHGRLPQRLGWKGETMPARRMPIATAALLSSIWR